MDNSIIEERRRRAEVQDALESHDAVLADIQSRSDWTPLMDKVLPIPDSTDVQGYFAGTADIEMASKRFAECTPDDFRTIAAFHRAARAVSQEEAEAVRVANAILFSHGFGTPGREHVDDVLPSLTAKDLRVVTRAEHIYNIR